VHPVRRGAVVVAALIVALATAGAPAIASPNPSLRSAPIDAHLTIDTPAGVTATAGAPAATPVTIALGAGSAAGPVAGQDACGTAQASGAGADLLPGRAIAAGQESNSVRNVLAKGAMTSRTQCGQPWPNGPRGGLITAAGAKAAAASTMPRPTTPRLTQAATYTLSGKVTGAGDVPLQDIEVWAEGVDNWNDGFTAADGTFSIPVPPDTYFIEFSDPTMAHADGWYSDTGFQLLSSDATAVAVTSASAANIDVQMPVAYGVSGTVTGTGSVPLPVIQVTLSSGAYEVTTFTEPDGTYMTGVPNGTYTVSFYDQVQTYAFGYWSLGGFTTDLDSASPLVVASADRTGINVQLPKNPQITGTVTGVGGVPLANITVKADDDANYLTQVNSVSTAANGSYSLPVPAGSYRVEFSDPASIYAGGFYSTGGYTADVDSSSVVAVTTSDVPGINVTLPRAVHIKGALKGPGGVAAPGMDVSVEGPSGSYWGTSGLGGAYSIAVTPGVYQLAVRDGRSTPTYPDGYAGTSGFTMDPGAAAAYVVTTADVTANLALPKMVRIKGKVTRSGGAGIAGIWVFSSAGYSARTAPDGTYSLPVPPSRNWSVQYYDPAGKYTSGFYRSTGFTLDPNMAGSISVGTSNVSGYNVVLPANHRISGKVTGPGGTGIAGISVEADSLTYSSMVETAADGTFSVGVPSGRYTLAFSDNNSTYSRGYLGVAGYSSNTSRTISVGSSNVAGANVEIPIAAAVTGRVTAVGGGGLGGIVVMAIPAPYTLTSSLWASVRSYDTTTAADGTYTLHLPPGAYVVSFGDPTSVHTSAYRAGAGVTLDPNGAQRVSVGVTPVGGIDGALDENLHITGTLTGPGSVGLAGVLVVAASTTWRASATTADDGTWSVAVPPGSYGVAYGVSQGSSYSSRSIQYGWYGTGGLQTTAAAASAVTVTTGDVGGVDSEVGSTAIHSISGVVTGVGTAALPGITVCASSSVAESCATSSKAGAYSLGVPAGSYTVSFQLQSYSYGSSVFSDGYWSATGTKTAKGKATPVEVSTADVGGVNAVLPRNLRIAGRLTGPNGVGVANAFVQAISTSGTGARARTGPDGRYTLSVPAGSYRVSFDTIFSTSVLPSGWYGGSGYTTTSPKAIVVTTSSVAGINIAVPKPVWLAGRITNSGGVGMGAAAIQAVKSAAYSVSAWARDDGQWSAVAPAGTYKVSIRDDAWAGYSALRFPNGWYASGGFTLAPSSATAFAVSTSNKTNINAVVTPGWRISGFVTGANGLPLANITGAASSAGYSAQSSTDEGGTWVVPVPAGSFLLHYSDPGGKYLNGYYSAGGLTPSAAAATPVDVPSADVSGVTIALDPDTTAPTATAPGLTLRTNAAASGTALPVTVSWGGADNDGGVGVATYELEKSTDGGGSWTTLSSSIAGTVFPTTVAASGTVRFAVRATDRAGNTGDWAEGVDVTPSLVQTSSGVTYKGTWSTSSGSAYSGGSTRYSSMAGASATFSFTGRSIAIVMTRATARGRIRVYVDGSSSYTTVDCYGAATSNRVQVWQKTWSTSGPHKVRIVVVGTSGRPRVDFDAISLIP
jgi:hypothetical protein